MLHSTLSENPSEFSPRRPSLLAPHATIHFCNNSYGAAIIFILLVVFDLHHAMCGFLIGSVHAILDSEARWPPQRCVVVVNTRDEPLNDSEYI